MKKSIILSLSVLLAVIMSFSAKAEELSTEEINQFIANIKKSLPQKLNFMTTWTDILYDKGYVVYVYQNNVDITNMPSTFNDYVDKEMCPELYRGMCSVAKEVFINNGLNVKVRYLDKNDKYIAGCTLDETTCNINTSQTTINSAERIANNEDELELKIKQTEKTLPKKVDEITDWTDLKYINNTITYVYKINVDITENVNTMSETKDKYYTKYCQEFKAQCQTLKPFIEKGKTVSLYIFDKQYNSIGTCELNKTNCM